MAALVWRTASGQGQYIDVSIHEACALTTESAIASYIYRGETLLRQTGRHHAPAPTSRTQFRAGDGRYVTALISGGLNPRNVRALAELMRFGVREFLSVPLNRRKFEETVQRVLAEATAHAH